MPFDTAGFPDRTIELSCYVTGALCFARISSVIQVVFLVSSHVIQLQSVSMFDTQHSKVGQSRDHNSTLRAAASFVGAYLLFS